MITATQPRVVCLCVDADADALAEPARIETAAGRIVLGPDCDTTIPHPLWNDPADRAGLTRRLVEVQRRKIDLADEVVIVTSPTGSLDQETTAELAYARRRGKPVRFWSPPHLLEITRGGLWQLCCTGRRADLSRPCAPAIPCGCTTTDARTPATGSICPSSPTGQHFLVEGTPNYPGPGCWLARHHDLPTAVRDDIAHIHGPGRYLVDYDTFYTDDLVLSVHATLDDPAPASAAAEDCERCGTNIMPGWDGPATEARLCPGCADDPAFTRDGGGEVPE